MNIEITPDHGSLYLYEEENVILKRFPVLMIEDEWILFADEKESRMEILAARVTFDAQGRIAEFDRHVDREQWHRLHGLWREYEKTHRRN